MISIALYYISLLSGLGNIDDIDDVDDDDVGRPTISTRASPWKGAVAQVTIE